MPTALRHSTIHTPIRSLLSLMSLTVAAIFFGTALGQTSTPSGANGGGGKRFVENIEAASGADGLTLHVTTNLATAPMFSVLPLRDPDRLVMDLPDFAWKPGRTAHLPSAIPAIQGIRVGQMSADPLVTRVVFDLTTPPMPFRYRAVSSTADGSLHIEFSEQAGASDIEGWRTLVGRRTSNMEHRTPAGGTDTVAPAKVQATAPEPPGKLNDTQIQQVASSSAAPLQVEANRTAIKPGASNTDPATTAAMSSIPPDPDVAPLQAGTSDSSTVSSKRQVAMQSTPASGSVWDDPVLRGAVAFAVIIIAGLAAVWTRHWLLVRSVEGSEERTTEEKVVSHQHTAQTHDTSVTTNAVKCKIVDGYLVLATENVEALANATASGIARAHIEQGTLDLTLDTGEAQSIVESESAESPKIKGPNSRECDGPDVVTRISDLVRSLTDENMSVRRAAAEGILEIAATGHYLEIAPYLDHADARVRSVAAGILGEAGAVACLPAIAHLIEDPDPTVRACVMYSFAQFGENAARYSDRVRSRLCDADSAVRSGAVEALAAFSPTSQETAEDLVHLTDDPDPLVRQAATTATLAFAFRGLAGPLVELLADFSRRPQALEILQQADDAALWRLLVAVRSSKSGSAQAAMDTLTYVMSRRWTADDFREEIESSDPEARLTAVEGLSMVGGAEAMRCIRSLAQTDPDARVRTRASEVLEQLAPATRS